MAAAAPRTYLDYAAYLELERSTGRKYAWCAGEVFAMAGGTLAHSVLAASVIRELWSLIGTKGCVVHTADAKIRIDDADLATHPDAAVVCGPVARHPGDRNAMTNPSVVVEVLSPSTEAYDRGAKFRAYRSIASLRDYILVSQEERLVEVYSRDEHGHWSITSAGPGESVSLLALQGALSVDALYEGVELEPVATASNTAAG